ncbi:MAG TPA: Flp pilus assembly protein CpaB [Castellaniella sp.]|uniref:Flp pilus assembly protein CpaB n=1 Tax=Castellaniella sp. TaxID=1955812 RepID=UPI002EFDBB76
MTPLRRLQIPRAAVLASVALLAGCLAAASLALHLKERERELEARTHMTMVPRIVAARDLPSGTRLMADHLAVRDFPSQWVSRDALPASRHLELEGLVLTSALRAGDLVTPAHTHRPQVAFSSQLAPGRRAITLPVDQVNSLSGLLQPGDLVDLYVSFDHQRKRLTAPLLQGMLVLATGRETRAGDPDSQSYSTVTLDAAPDEVVRLVAARQAGTLTAILRHPEDSRADLRAVRGDLATLLGLVPAPIPKNRRPVILYGASGSRSGLVSPSGVGALPHGWFELPPDAVRAGWAGAYEPSVESNENDGLRREINSASEENP